MPVPLPGIGHTRRSHRGQASDRPLRPHQRRAACDDAPGAKLSHAVISKTFRGDIVGTSLTHMIAAMSDRQGSAAYVAIERVSASVHGRPGTFVLQHTATGDRGQRTLEIIVVPDTATGELTGLRGRVDVDLSDGKHAYVFDYTFAPDGD